MEESQFYFNLALKYTIYISTFLLFAVLIMSNSFLLLEMNTVILVTNIIVLFLLYNRSQREDSQILEPIYWIGIYFCFAYIWNTSYQLNSNYFENFTWHSNWHINPYQECNVILLILFLFSFLLLYIGYDIAMYFMRNKNENELNLLGLNNIHTINNIEIIYSTVLILKVFAYGSGLLGSAGNIFVQNIFTSLLNVLFSTSYYLLVIIYVKHYHRKKNIFLAFILLEIFCIFISGNRRELFYLLIPIAICTYYLNDRIINYTKVLKFSIIFLCCVWPILNIGNDLANTKIDKTSTNLQISDIIQYYISDEKIDRKESKQNGLARILVTDHFKQNLVAYDAICMKDKLLGPVGVNNIIQNILPSFIFKAKSYQYVIELYQQFAYNRFVKMRTCLAFDFITELIFSYGSWGIIGMFIMGLFYGYLFCLFTTSNSLLMRIFYLTYYYRFSLGIFNNMIVGDTLTFYKLLFGVLLLRYILKLFAKSKCLL